MQVMVGILSVWSGEVLEKPGKAHRRRYTFTLIATIADVTSRIGLYTASTFGFIGTLRPVQSGVRWKDGLGEPQLERFVADQRLGRKNSGHPGARDTEARPCSLARQIQAANRAAVLEHRGRTAQRRKPV